MAERPRRPSADPPEEGTGPVELHTEALELEPAPPSGAGPPRWMKPAAVVAALGVAVAAGLAYRSHHRRKVLRDGLARAAVAMRADTQAGYLAAAKLLEPLSRLDPVEAGAMRAFALAMLFADYRDARAAAEAEALLVEPDRAPEVPGHAHLATAALALGRLEAGNAANHASRAASPVGLALQARTALLAGNLGAASEPLARAVETDPTLPMALALRGDVLRRGGNAAEARRSYLDALAASPHHARAAFGLGKLALSGQADAAEARDALSRLAAPDAAPPNERARAALHLAALQARAGDRAGAAATVERAGLEPAARAWLERAAAEEELARGRYRVVGGAPPPLQSASDDDPYVAPPPAPPRAEPVKAVKAAQAKVAKRKAVKKVAAKKPAKKAPAKKRSAKKKPVVGQKSPARKKPPEAPAR